GCRIFRDKPINGAAMYDMKWLPINRQDGNAVTLLILVKSRDSIKKLQIGRFFRKDPRLSSRNHLCRYFQAAQFFFRRQFTSNGGDASCGGFQLLFPEVERKDSSDPCSDHGKDHGKNVLGGSCIALAD